MPYLNPHRVVSGPGSVGRARAATGDRTLSAATHNPASNTRAAGECTMTIVQAPLERADARAGVVELVEPRGPASAWVLNRLAALSMATTGSAATPYTAAVAPDPDLVDLGRLDGWSEDVQLALYLCHELHSSGLPGVPDDAEWDPVLIAFRRRLEFAFETALRSAVVLPPAERPLARTIEAMVAADDGPSLSRYMEHAGTLDQMRQFVVHRSAYQLEEGDLHTFAIPRIRGAGKRTLAMIQAGEYGADGDDREMHAALFARTMRALGLDDCRHAYLNELPASALAVSNLISLFGLRRRWRGALIGHLAAFELTSVGPMGRYSRALQRLGASYEARRFYDVHVLADAEHERWALEMVEQVLAAEPVLADDIVFGVACALAVERRFAEGLLGPWQRNGAVCLAGCGGLDVDDA